MEPEFAFPIALPPRGSRELLRSVHAQLRTAIVNGRLRPGLRLPTTRAFAATYGVSRNVAVAMTAPIPITPTAASNAIRRPVVVLRAALGSPPTRGPDGDVGAFTRA